MRASRPAHSSPHHRSFAKSPPSGEAGSPGPQESSGLRITAPTRAAHGDVRSDRDDKETEMTRELGVWTYEDCALVLIDYQNEMFEVIRSETDADLAALNGRLLAKSGKACDVPIVLSTVGVELGFNGPTLPSVLSELEGIEPIDRSSMNAFEDDAFREAVKATGRKRLIIGGPHPRISLPSPAA